MAENYLQRSNRQDDSRLGNDDPLMELSRIMGTPEQDESVSGSNDDFALDLERELMGGFDEEVTSQSASAETASDQQDEDTAARDFQESIERELSASQPEQPYDVPAQPVAAYEEPDYADYEPEAVYADSEAGEGVDSYAQAPAPVEPAAPVAAAPAMSLEDELETLLAGSARPVIQRSANASWGYGSRSNVAGRTEPAPVISRATAYQQPAAAPEPVQAAYEAPAPVAYQQPAVEVPEPVSYAAPEVSQEPQAPYAEPEDLDIEIEDAFDDQELIAALDDFEMPLDADEAPEPVREQIAVPVAASIAGAPKLPEVHALSDYADELDRAAKSVQAPDVDTIAVTENRVDYTESLDLPTVNYEDDAPQHSGLSELESEFAEVFGSINSDSTQHNDFAAVEEPAKPEAAKDEYADIFADVFGNEAEQGRYNQAGYAAAGVAAAGAAGIASQARESAPRYQHGPEDDTDFGYDPRQDDVDIAAGTYAQNENKPRRSPLFVPGVAAAVVLVAVAGAMAYKWTGSTGGEPVVIMADKTPIKIQPEKTANAVVPNQDKAVFDKGATTAPVTPKQEQLVTTREDPVDLAADEDDEVPIADKVDARVDPAEQDLAVNEPAPERNGALAPRKVQTMVVKPDGTMVASITPDAPPAGTGEAAAPVERPAGVSATAPSSAADPVGALAGAEPVEPEPALAPVKPAAAAPVAPKAAVAAKPVETKKITQETVASAPRNVPVVESRPAEQPLDIVDRVPARNAPAQQVASAAPAAGSYFIQVASQPSVEGAQKTYASLSQKHAGVIGGRGVDIKQAEIAGKGTFYRVRIPAGSKSDAVNLCSKYKSAGGSCFVTQ
ncbi:SPOR domain-containing protein [Phyllobacterium sp. SB3]|uniref:SPOR domain-containing protein n=1 Tax=Phyllobacterium sp. SB3 TaxID=3156073 RepID=UPI0032AF167F